MSNPAIVCPRTMVIRDDIGEIHLYVDDSEIILTREEAKELAAQLKFAANSEGNV